MAKFKVGDRVVIRDDLQNYKNFGTMSVTQSMRDMHGKTSTITYVFTDRYTVDQLDRYRILGSPWWWCNDCFSSSKAPYPVTVITTDGTTTTATLQEGKRVIRTATAKCSPGDTFDYATSAKLALDRLFLETAETKPKNPALMFKVGDRVWDVNEESYATIIRVDEKDDVVPYKVKYADGNTNWQCKQNIVPCGPDAEPPKPKCYTGKMVCIKSGYSWWTVGKVYDIMDGTITADDGDKYSGYISAEDARHAGRTIGGAPFPGSDAGHNPDNEFIPFVES